MIKDRWLAIQITEPTCPGDRGHPSGKNNWYGILRSGRGSAGDFIYFGLGIYTEDLVFYPSEAKLESILDLKWASWRQYDVTQTVGWGSRGSKKGFIDVGTEFE